MTQQNLWKSKHSKVGTKPRILNCNIKPVLLYESETRRVTKQLQRRTL